MMLLDKDALSRRFIQSQGPAKPALRITFKKLGQCRQDFNCANDEKRFDADLAHVMVSIDALMCCMPAKKAMTDERISRMLLSLQGFATPNLKSRFKSQAADVANRKSSRVENGIRSRPARFRFNQEAKKEGSKFITPRFADGLWVMPIPVTPQALADTQKAVAVFSRLRVGKPAAMLSL